MTGTLINTAAVLAGSGIGLAVGAHLPKRINDSVMLGLGFVTLTMGVAQAVPAFNDGKLMVTPAALILGVVIGELLRLHGRLESVAEYLRKKFRSEHGDFITGFVTASLLFCVGPLTLLGATFEGVGNPQGLRYLLLKSALDFFASIALASTFGMGVLASALFVLVFQGALTLLGFLAGDVLTPAMQLEMVGVGGLMLLGLSLVLFGLKRSEEVRVINFLPGVLLAPVLVLVFDLVMRLIQ
ncbi:MAG: DUF554 domain-containing protein [Planctomycetota bacterium]